LAKSVESVLPSDETTKMLITIAVSQLNAVCESIGKLKCEMRIIAEKLPEYKTVLKMHGVGETLASQLIAEIGDINNFPKRTSLACFAGIEPPENQSGKYEQKSRRISKQGSPHLRKALFQAMTCILKLKRADEPVFQFIDRKRSEGKPYKVYMIAGCNKFLRIYYARVKKSLALLEKAS
jgi:transposase